MRKLIYIPVLLCALMLALTSCAEEEFPLFDTTISNIYFEWAKEGKDGRTNKIDSLGVSFAFVQPVIIDTIINVPVKTLGYTSSIDRTIDIKVLTSGTTAEEGKHYLMPSTVVVPADSVRAYIPITLLRDASLKDEGVALKFQLQDNQYFKTNLYSTEEHNTVDRFLSYTEFQISFSDMPTKPSWWTSREERYIGAWSTKKMYLIVELAGISGEKLVEEPSGPEFFGYVRLLRDYLKVQSVAGTPVMEDDGVTEMKVGFLASSI